MSEKRLTLETTLDDKPVALTVVRASGLMGMERAQLIYSAIEENKQETNSARGAMRLITYPDLVSCTVEVSGIPWPIPFLDFIQLDEVFLDDWSALVYRVNPQWKTGQPEQTPEKKASSSSMPLTSPSNQTKTKKRASHSSPSSPGM